MSLTYAIIETGGKQYQVQEGDVLEIELLPKASSEEILFDKVLLISQDGKVKIGTPIVKEAKVLGKLVKETKGEKIIAFKYKRRKGYRRKVGHRQKYSVVKIESVKVA